MFLLLIGILLCAATVTLVARAVALPRLRAESGLAQIGAYGFPSDRASEGRRAHLTEALDRLAERLGAAILPRFGDGDDTDVRKLLASAGVYEISPGKFLGYRVLSAVALTGLWLWFGPTAGLPAAMFAVTLPVLTLSGWTIPLSVLRVRAERRLEEIDRELPELIDSLVVTLEAGMGFGGALQMVAREMRGPLGDEISFALQEQSMGLASNAALENMLERVDTPAMGSFVRAVIQGETLGVSIGEIMRAVAVDMRARRRASAEQRAQKAPIKMLFPLAFCVFPAILIILLYPAVVEFKNAIGA